MGSAWDAMQAEIKGGDVLLVERAKAVITVHY
jgi:hypothetical protein